MEGGAACLTSLQALALSAVSPCVPPARCARRPAAVWGSGRHPGRQHRHICVLDAGLLGARQGERPVISLAIMHSCSSCTHHAFHWPSCIHPHHAFMHSSLALMHSSLPFFPSAHVPCDDGGGGDDGDAFIRLSIYSLIHSCMHACMWRMGPTMFLAHVLPLHAIKHWVIKNNPAYFHTRLSGEW